MLETIFFLDKVISKDETENDGLCDDDNYDEEDMDRLPDFANEKARELHSEIKEQKQKLEKIGTDVTDTKKRSSLI